MPDLTRKQLTAAIYFALALGTLAVYAPMLRHDFIGYDDPGYILDNPHVKSGLTFSGIIWAFKSGYAANWHPLTWISHMLDCQLFGLNPAGHHLMNLFFHTANTLLLFLLLNNLTNAIWRSAFVAALFAWHPLHVESVAWAAERKDVLSAFFFLLTLIFYVRFVHAKIGNRQSAIGNYLLSLFLFACGLMSKPMVVTLPFVLLLLDFWPLQRFSIQNSKFKIQNFSKLIVEKIPFFALAAISSFITYRVQNGALWSSSALTFPFRLANALMSYLRYISKFFWPTDLALIYPYPHFWPLTGVIAAAVVLATLSAIFIFQAKRFPYLAVGWFWFLGTLVPAIGLVQVGVQAMADRYSYIPSIGLAILVAWGANDLLDSRRQKNLIAAIAASLALAGCLAATSIQLTYWRNSLTIFGHTIAVTTDNYAAEDCLGKAFEGIGKNKEAEECYSEAVRVEPDFPAAQFDLGMILLEQRDFNSASNHLATAVQLWPGNPVMQYDFGIFQLQHGDPKKAAAHFKSALAAKPDFAEARRQLDSLAKTNSPALDIGK